jgi:hypothetical protein
MSRERKRRRDDKRRQPEGVPFHASWSEAPTGYVIGPEDRMGTHEGPRGLQRNPIFLTVDAAITDAELLDLMKRGLEARARGAKLIRAAFHGWNDDPRELWQIPEAVALAQRLVAFGFIAVLEYADMFPEYEPFQQDFPHGTKMAMGPGALEVWLLARGLLNGYVCTFSQSDRDQFEADLLRASELCRQKTGIAPWPRQAANVN